MVAGMAKVIQFEERAVATLRERLGAAESANEDLIAFARGHSGATASIHRAVLAIMETDGVDALFDAVTRQWPAILGIDHVVLALVADGQGFTVHQGRIEQVESRLIDRAISRLEPVSMTAVQRGHPLFGCLAPSVRSQAIILLPAKAPFPYGMLLLGEREAASLDTRHGAQLLGFLGSSLAAMIRRWLTNP
jgi:uncharacterized protein YigA (DUF484 family)